MNSLTASKETISIQEEMPGTKGSNFGRKNTPDREHMSTQGSKYKAIVQKM
jgi:hypothetical protein